MRTVVGVLTASFIILSCCLIVLGNQAHALSVNKRCSDIEVVYARGSGQDLGAGEAIRFRDQLFSRINEPTSVNFYELGTEAYGGQQYQAVTVGEWWKNGNAVGAGLSAGYSNDYGKSVDSGIGELRDYLARRNRQCPNARIILGGYSQGAQVMGQALSELSAGIQSKIDFVALFGDPKLYLPEGEGIHPPACRGVDFSRWRRIIGSCRTDSGSLGARKPFLPQAMESKTGLWCNADDFVCGSSVNVRKVEGHGEYKEVGGGIDLAALEIAQRLKLTLPPTKAIAINASKRAGEGASGKDTVFVIARSGWSSPERLSQAKDFILATAPKLQGQNSRIAVVIYDGGVNWAVLSLSRLLEDQAEPLGYIHRLQQTVSTTPVKPLLRSLMTTFKEYEWKKGAIKSVVVVSDSEFFNPDNYGLITFAEVAKRALEIDPVNVFPVVPSSLQSAYQGLADVTSGQVIAADDDPSATLADTVTKITERPTAFLKNSEYLAKPGEEVVFDASDSHLAGGTITKYEWDFDGDSTFEQTTTEPKTSHVYPAMFTGNVQVRVTGSNNTLTNASATIQITPFVTVASFPAPVDLAATVSSTAKRVSTIDLSWRPNPRDSVYSYPPTSWVISMNGTVLGKIAGDRTSIQVTDVPRDDDVEFSVTGLTYDGQVGETTSVSVAKLQPEPPAAPMSWLEKLLMYIRNFLGEWGIRFPL